VLPEDFFRVNEKRIREIYFFLEGMRERGVRKKSTERSYRYYLVTVN
jgi:hypothetical protein